MGTGYGGTIGSTATGVCKSVNLPASYPTLANATGETYQSNQHQNFLFDQGVSGGEAFPLHENMEYLRNSTLPSSQINCINVNVSTADGSYYPNSHQHFLQSHMVMAKASTPPLPQYPSISTLLKSPAATDAPSTLSHFIHSRGGPEGSKPRYGSGTVDASGRSRITTTPFARYRSK